MMKVLLRRSELKTQLIRRPFFWHHCNLQFVDAEIIGKVVKFKAFV
jgi:hypothetical protein